jgi:cytochrome c peroxidase
MRWFWALAIPSFIGINLVIANENAADENKSQYDIFLQEEPDELIIPLGLPPIPWPTDNPYSKKKAKLGRLLYFDPRLSSDGKISCSTCHSERLAFTDHKSIAQGIQGNMGARHSPTVINACYQTQQFWDGRAKTLEEQAKGPIGNPKEMTLASDIHDAHKQCQERVQKINGYRVLFKEVFGNDACSIDDIAKAIATFERTILSGNSPYDRYLLKRDKTALTEEQIAGYGVFKRVGCANCHGGALFTDGRFLNIGVGMDASNPDTGRYGITGVEKDWGAFKIPTLREVANTGPYMHDGSHKTLEEVVDYYDKGGTPNKNLHPLMKPLHLTDKEKKALVVFMQGLSGEGWQHCTSPQEFPE